MPHNVKAGKRRVVGAVNRVLFDVADGLRRFICTEINTIIALNVKKQS